MINSIVTQNNLLPRMDSALCLVCGAEIPIELVGRQLMNQLMVQCRNGHWNEAYQLLLAYAKRFKGKARLVPSA